MADVAPNDSSVSPSQPPAIVMTPHEAASPESAATSSSSSSTRRTDARKNARSPTGGHYADPLSPIASTPLKRQRAAAAGKSTSSTADSSVKKPKLDAAAAGAPAVTAKSTFLSPRKLMNEYDDAVEEEKQTETETQLPSTSDTAEPPSGDDELFSPVLKPPPPLRVTRTASSTSPSSPSPTNSSSNNAHSNAIDAATAFLSSSSTCSEQNDDDDDDDAADAIDAACETAVACEEADDEDDDETVYAIGSESGSDASTCDQEFNPFYFMKTLPKYEDIVPTPRAIALPAKEPDAPKISLVLDLDETLVHCSVDDVEDPDLQFPVTFNGVEYTVKVKKRPHMETFLARVAKRFEVVVFTASHRAYAETLLNLLDPHKTLIQHRLYRDDCLDVYGNYLKDLTVLGRDLSKVLLVDNSPHAFGYQVGNGVPIETWYDDAGDDELMRLLPFLEGLADADDVRPIIATQFEIQKLIDATPDELV